MSRKIFYYVIKLYFLFFSCIYINKMLNLISKGNLTFTSNKDCGCDKKVSKSINTEIITYKNIKLTNNKLKKKKLKKHTRKYIRKHSRK